VTGADAGITLNTVTQLRLLGQIWLGAASTTYKGGPWSVASVFGGVLPALWSIVVFNAYGGALDATEGNHNKRYQGIQAQIV
jgi:hypothetical protein